MAAVASPVGPILTFVGRDSSYRGPAVEPNRDEQPVNLLDLKHPEYMSKYEAWLDLGLLYEGGAALKMRAERVLKKRPREDEEVFAARMDRFTYQNILGTGLGWYGAAMFNDDPEIFFNGKAGNEQYTEFLGNCDGVGTKYVDFFKRVFQFMLTYGAAWILTDIKALGEGEEVPKTKAEEKARGILEPHLVVYTPLNVINWELDELGNIVWAVIKTEVRRQKFLQRPEIVSTWYYYDKERYQVYEYVSKPEEQTKVATDDVGKMAKRIRQGKHALSHADRVPIRKLALSDGLWIANRAYLLLIDHLNQDNTLAWSLFMSNLAMPVVIGPVDVTNAMTVSEVGYLQFPEGTEYKWSEPEGKSFSHSAKRVESLREEAFRSMNLQAQGRSMRATPAMQSGRSKILEMAPAKEVLASMGDDVRRHMQDVLVDVKDARQEKEVEPDVRGFNFQEDMTTEEVFSATSVLNMGIPSTTFEKYVQKKVAKAWMSDANRDQLVKVYKEIDNGPTMDEQRKKEMKERVQAAMGDMRERLTSKKPPGGGLEPPPGRGGAGSKPGSEPVGGKKV